MDLELNDTNIYVIDRFEGDIAICENRDTKEILKVNKKDLPKDVSEGSIIKKIDSKYEKDIVLEKEITDRIRAKMDDLWN